MVLPTKVLPSVVRDAGPAISFRPASGPPGPVNALRASPIAAKAGSKGVPAYSVGSKREIPLVSSELHSSGTVSQASFWVTCEPSGK